MTLPEALGFEREDIDFDVKSVSPYIVDVYTSAARPIWGQGTARHKDRGASSSVGAAEFR